MSHKNPLTSIEQGDYIICEYRTKEGSVLNCVYIVDSVTEDYIKIGHKKFSKITGKRSKTGRERIRMGTKKEIKDMLKRMSDEKEELIEKLRKLPNLLQLLKQVGEHLPLISVSLGKLRKMEKLINEIINNNN